VLANISFASFFEAAEIRIFFSTPHIMGEFPIGNLYTSVLGLYFCRTKRRRHHANPDFPPTRPIELVSFHS
jgi:hypothetical protein